MFVRFSLCEDSEIKSSPFAYTVSTLKFSKIFDIDFLNSLAKISGSEVEKDPKKDVSSFLYSP